jgi:hypothetical protein
MRPRRSLDAAQEVEVGMARRFLLERPENENVIAKCGFDQERRFTVEVFVEDRSTTSFTAAGMDGALEFLIEHGFLTAADLIGAHEVVFDEPPMPLSDGTKRALEAVVNFLRVGADSRRCSFLLQTNVAC